MSWHNKVIWTEGLFLRPQLFQQQERYLESYAHLRAASSTPFYWGFHRYAIDIGSLSLGKLVISSAAGIFTDGTPFQMPAQTPPPPPLTIQPEHIDQLIYLAVPIRTPNAEEATFDEGSGGSLARYAVIDEELRDANSIGQGPKLVQLAQLRLRLLPHKELTDAWIGLPIAKVTALHSDGSAELDFDLIPPVTGIGTNTLLSSWVTKIQGLTHLRGNTLASRLTGADGKASDAAEVSDYLLLQILNRYEPLLNHMLTVQETSPEDLYTLLCSFGGELSTFVRTTTRRPKKWPAYQHVNPYVTFKELTDDVHAMLNEVLVRSAQRIDFEVRPHGMRLASIDPATLQSFGNLVLAVAAQMPSDLLVTQFAAQSKVGPSDRLPELIRSHLPGISMSALPVPPRQIPFNAGFVYYELGNSGPMWEHILKHGGLAMHIAGDFPGLRLELWGVREK
ncbi:type VI secretion system baseplate subunit TssK [Collimonas sp. NPDC087041]|uniref:type VI secretion system baseplate subunit TssK n=1 Tax=Collimonas sp. NPDC087041 TaxID=3363960 RepID=UPI003810ECCA